MTHGLPEADPWRISTKSGESVTAEGKWKNLIYLSVPARCGRFLDRRNQNRDREQAVKALRDSNKGKSLENISLEVPEADPWRIGTKEAGDGFGESVRRVPGGLAPASGDGSASEESYLFIGSGPLEGILMEIINCSIN